MATVRDMDSGELVAAEDTRTHEAIRKVREDTNRLRGRLFELIEAFGLEPEHCAAAKNVVRRTTYDMQASLEATLRRELR